MKLTDIKTNPQNPRLIKDDKFKKLVKSLQDFPQMMELRPIIIDENNVIQGGNMRYKALKELGFKDIPDTWVKQGKELTPEQWREFVIKDNVGFGEWDFEQLANEWDTEQLTEWGLDLPVWDETETEEKEQNKKLSDRFIIPPFSVLDTKQGAWQQRKNYWLNLGIRSELGRDASVGGSKMVAGYDKNGDRQTGLVTDSDTSIFDPVLCELAYQWFNVPKGKILDPFAGGSVRGIVAAKLGFEYLGNDLSEKQIIANRNNAVDVLQDAELYPTWNIGDSLQIDTIAKDYRADMIFSCPPYADLEVYSDAKEDISNMPYKQFIEVYNQIIKKACDQLKEDRFAVFVVGDVRDKKGFYQNFVSYTINAFVDCGVLLYNEMILVNSVGSLAIRAGKQFSAGRKVGKQHQNVLVFYKGNPKNIKANYPELDLSYMQDEIENE